MVSKVVIVSCIAIVAIVAAGIGSYYYFVINQADNVDSSSNDDGVPRIIAPNGTLTAQWWQWAISIPIATNPAADTTGEFCDEGQSGPVWHVAGSFGGPVERSCNIPVGKSILVPIINGECSEAEYPEQSTEEQLRGCALATNEGVSELMFSINGLTVEETVLRESHRIQSPLFIMTFPEDNIFGLPPVTTRAVSDGYWVLVEGLTAGNYDMHFRGAIIDPSGANNFITEATYHITVS